MIEIKAQVRINSLGWLELFYISDNVLTCFCFEEGHNDAGHDYRLKCKPAPKETALVFAQRVEDYYNTLPDGQCKITLVRVLR